MQRLPELKFLPLSMDKWLSRNGMILKYDKIEHFIRDALICLVFGFWAAVTFNIFYEYIDGTRPWAPGKRVEGFSIKDMVAGMLGAILMDISRRMLLWSVIVKFF